METIISQGYPQAARRMGGRFQAVAWGRLVPCPFEILEMLTDEWYNDILLKALHSSCFIKEIPFQPHECPSHCVNPVFGALYLLTNSPSPWHFGGQPMHLDFIKKCAK